MYEEQLLDQELLLGFVIQQVEASNVAQLPFILVLLQDYLSEVLLSEPLSARLSSVCFARLSEVGEQFLASPLTRCRSRMAALQRRTTTCRLH